MSADEETIQPGAPCQGQAEVTEQDITQIDARPFFFRHVTVFVKLLAIFLMAGMRSVITLWISLLC